MLIKDVMTRHPACCAPSDTVESVAKKMLEYECGEIPVCDGANLVGVITDRDITCRAVAAGKSPKELPASEIMTHHPFIIHEEQSLEAALAVMDEKLVRRLPVVNENLEIVGIVSQADLVARVPTRKVARLVKSVSEKTRKPAAAAAH